MSDPAGTDAGRPRVYAHRGASGSRPEHTMAAYRLAIEMGSDGLEIDVVPTSDGVLVCRHEHEIGATTDVAQHPEYAGRRTTRTVPGRKEATGWFVEDFTYAELATLRTRERMPRLRPANTAYDGQEPIPRLTDVLDLVVETRATRDLALMIELKHPAYLRGLGLDPAGPLLGELEAHGLHDDVILECFEPTALADLAIRTDLPLLQLLELGTNRPADLVAQGDPRTFADLATPAALDAAREHVRAMGVHTTYVYPLNPDGTTGILTTFVDDAHLRGLSVTAFTLRRENRFLPDGLKVGDDPAAPGDLADQAREFREAGVDGLITDNPDVVLAALSSA